MDSAGLITTITLVLSITSVILTGLFSIRTARLGHQLEAEREQRHQEQSALKAAERVYEPLAQAAAELQSRIFNIVETGWVPLMKRYESHGDYAVTSTAFLFAHYFGWIEARRQAVKSATSALEAVQAGYEVGTRTIVDLLIAQRQLFQAQRDYSQARHNYIVNGLRLKQNAGDIERADVAEVNALLTDERKPVLIPDPTRRDEDDASGIDAVPPDTSINDRSGDESAADPRR